MTQPEPEVTRILQEWSAGDGSALDRLIPMVFAHVRELAARALAPEPPGHTLQPTALVNEVYLRLAGCRSVRWKNREQFFGFLADLMRRILIDHARQRRAVKRGRDAIMISLDKVEVPAARHPDLLALYPLLDRLKAIDSRKHRVVELRFFIGLKNQEIATVLAISVKTVEREWRAAKAWLQREAGDGSFNERG